MKIKALLMNDTDNVVTCIEKISAGETVSYRMGGKEASVIAREDIPSWHKIALKNIDKDETVIKYGEAIGAADANIEKGGHVSHLNMVSLPRDYDGELGN